MQTLSQSPLDPAFVQNPYPFYESARATGPFFRWQDYDLVCTPSAAAVNAIDDCTVDGSMHRNRMPRYRSGVTSGVNTGFSSRPS